MPDAEARFEAWFNSDEGQTVARVGRSPWSAAQMGFFAGLVKGRKDGAGEEREACADLCGKLDADPAKLPYHCADAIRARGETT